MKFKLWFNQSWCSAGQVWQNRIFSPKFQIKLRAFCRKRAIFWNYVGQECFCLFKLFFKLWKTQLQWLHLKIWPMDYGARIKLDSDNSVHSYHAQLIRQQKKLKWNTPFQKTFFGNHSQKQTNRQSHSRRLEGESSIVPRIFIESGFEFLTSVYFGSINHFVHWWPPQAKRRLLKIGNLGRKGNLDAKSIA